MRDVSATLSRRLSRVPEEGFLTYRYAIYWAPPGGSALAEIGETWLGRNADSGKAIARPTLPGFAAAVLEAATAEPRRYGLHATLKPPFRLAEDAGPAALEAMLDEVARSTPAVVAPSLTLKRIGRFLALVPGAPAPALEALAALCVERFDAFRAASDAAELARRRAAALTPSQERNLARWGYPYVMEDFRFHVSLTGAIERGLADRLEPALLRLFAPALAAPLVLDELALFAEPAPGAAFRLVRRVRLA
jgi:putative phosphonate metabolism protein